MQNFRGKEFVTQMFKRPLQSIFCATVAISMLGLASCNSMNSPHPAPSALSAEEAKSIAIDAYIYGYSLITTEVTRVQMTNVLKAEGLHMPMGQFGNVKRYPPGNYRGVSAPNADTLYSVAWLDLRKEPMVFTYPDMGTRYFLFPMYSLWMPVIESPGSRTEGDKAGTYLVTGPDWHGIVPAGMRQIRSSTKYALILGRTYANGTEADYDAVNALQAQYAVTPLSAVGAGDSFLAALIWRLASGADLADCFRQAVAAGAAALLNPGTELCRPHDVERLAAGVIIEAGRSSGMPAAPRSPSESRD
jgi:hypothetical protein